jgi:hypothetical protein
LDVGQNRIWPIDMQTNVKKSDDAEEEKEKSTLGGKRNVGHELCQD